MTVTPEETKLHINSCDTLKWIFKGQYKQKKTKNCFKVVSRKGVETEVAKLALILLFHGLKYAKKILSQFFELNSLTSLMPAELTLTSQRNIRQIRVSCEGSNHTLTHTCTSPTDSPGVIIPLTLRLSTLVYLIVLRFASSGSSRTPDILHHTEHFNKSSTFISKQRRWREQ